ncbi:MAG TPA: DUF4838 domain-containing protein [Chthoniobacteraceae bacterium]|nr:DUF4838 domain-containing protein [Chthoniobacteraceae bacterium]
MINLVSSVRNIAFAMVAASALLAAGGGLIATARGAEPVHLLAGPDGIACEIVVAGDAPTMTQFAGKELQQLLSRSLGGEVPLVKVPGGKAATSIVLGSDPSLEALEADLASLPRDGFVIRSSGKVIHIAGNDDNPDGVEGQIASSAWHRRGKHPQRGTLNGVYEFLERYLGVRFYFPGRFGTIVPEHAEVALPALKVEVAPAMTARSMGYSGALYEGFEEEGYPGKNREAQTWYYKTLDALRLRLQTDYVPHCHGLRSYGYIGRFGESHPEYFALMGNGRRHSNASLPQAGQLCFSSGITEEIFLDAKAYLTGQSAESREVSPRGDGRYAWSPAACQPGYFDIMPQDGFYPCHCEPCQKHFQGFRYREINRTTTSKFLWDFFCDVAERLKKEGVPGKVTTMAYSPYSEIPEREIPDNLEVALCPVGPDAVRDFGKVRDHVRGWYEKTGKRKLWLWINVGKFSQLAVPGVPFMIPRATGRYFKELAPYISGAYFTLIMNDAYLYKYLNAYIANKVMWDPQVDVDALLEEHYRVMFGPAAGVMEKIYDRFEEIWLEQIRGNTIETSIGETAVPPSEHQLWNVIYSESEVASIGERFAQAERACADRPEYRERVAFMRRNLFDPLVAAKERYQRTLKGIDALQLHVPELEAGSTLRIDGVPDEAAWQQAEEVTLTHLGHPDRKEPLTTVKVGRNETDLFIAFDCAEPEMARIVASDLPRDANAIHNESSVEVLINPSGDRKHYRQWSVNAAGSVSDLSGRKEGASRTLDPAWQSGVKYAVRRNASSWTVEMAIPFRDLEPHLPGGFPINFVRNRVVKGEPIIRLSWSPFLQRSFHEPENFGRLRFGPLTSENLLMDGDFAESGEEGGPGRSWWVRASDGSRVGVGTVEAASFPARNALQLECPDGEGAISVRQYLPGLKPEREYRVSFHVRTEGLVPAGRKGGAQVSVRDGKSHSYPTVPYTGTQPWLRQAFTFRTGPGANVASRSYLSLGLRAAKGVVWFGDVRVEPVE